MLGLIFSIIVFNLIAYKTNKRLTKNQILHIWTFTVAFQSLFDTIVDLKYSGYWYFTKNIDWASLLDLIFLVPPVNMMFVNWFPFKDSNFKKICYFLFWEIFLLSYEAFSLLPEPFGFFHYGWWNMGISAILDPILLMGFLGFYRLILKYEDLIKYS